MLELETLIATAKRHYETVFSDYQTAINEVQLVALQFSQTNNLGSNSWLITDAHNQAVIRDGLYTTEFSRHNTWLPWLDINREEFSATTPLEAYQTTVVAPLAQAKIFDPKTGRFRPHPPSVTDKMQEVYDIIEPAVRGLLEQRTALFAHLLFLGSQHYQLITFQILRDGTISYLSHEKLDDPLEIGLPSASELGFHAFSKEQP